MDGTEGDPGRGGQIDEADARRTGFAAYCSQCRAERPFLHTRVSNRRHLLLTLLTAGLWSIVWISVLVGKSLRPWRCAVCGWHKPEFRNTRPGSIPSPAPPPSEEPPGAKKVQPPTVE